LWPCGSSGPVGALALWELWPCGSSGPVGAAMAAIGFRPAASRPWPLPLPLRTRPLPNPPDSRHHCTMEKQYDREYFDRWYHRGDIGGRQRLARKVALAVATAEYHLERPLRTVLDIGCGEGAWRAPLLKLRPKARYLGFDSSEYAIARHGRRRNLHYARFADFAQLRPCAPVDLLVCSDVLHYLTAREIDRG